MPQSRSTTLRRHKKKERWRTNKDKTNTTYETTDAQTKKNCNRGTALGRSVGKLVELGWGGGSGCCWGGGGGGAGAQTSFTHAKQIITLLFWCSFNLQIYVWFSERFSISLLKRHSETHIIMKTVIEQSNRLKSDLNGSHKYCSPSPAWQKHYHKYPFNLMHPR